LPNHRPEPPIPGCHQSIIAGLQRFCGPHQHTHKHTHHFSHISSNVRCEHFLSIRLSVGLPWTRKMEIQKYNGNLKLHREYVTLHTNTHLDTHTDIDEKSNWNNGKAKNVHTTHNSFALLHSASASLSHTHTIRQRCV